MPDLKQNPRVYSESTIIPFKDLPVGLFCTYAGEVVRKRDERGVSFGTRGIVRETRPAFYLEIRGQTLIDTYIKAVGVR